MMAHTRQARAQGPFFRQFLPWWPLAVAAVLVGGCCRFVPAGRFDYSQVHMGVRTRLVVYAHDQAEAQRACTAAFARVAALEDIFSDYRPHSEAMRLCARAGQGPVKVSDDLFTVLRFALELSRRSEGAFDVTVGPYVALWRQARRTGALPSESELDQARPLVGWSKVRLDERARTVELLVPAMRLDFGGIAKGYAGDEAMAVLRRNGIRAAMFEAGGDIVLGDAPPAAVGWAITLPGPREPALLRNLAVSTSGATEQYVVIGGRRYSHVIDPRTGVAATQPRLATVVAANGMTADALSTACGLLDEAKARALARSYNARLQLSPHDPEP